MSKVLITGASRGIGKVTADLFRSRGFDVVAPSRSELDLADPASVAAYLETDCTDYEVIVNNAGVNDIHFLEDISDEEIYRTLEINTISPLKIIRHFVPRMKDRKYGKIVNIGSIWGVVSKEQRTTYSISKHALHGLTQTLAAELAPYNILVNTICPGFTMTDLTRKNNTPKQISELENKIPMCRLAEPKEIAKVILFLCSQENSYLTGQQIVVDGGFSII